MKEFMKKVKYLSRRYKLLSYVIIFIALYLVCIYAVGFIVEPSEAELSQVCEKHLRISRDFSNIERYEGASFEVVHNSISNTDDIIVTIQEKTYKVVARYTSENELISFELIYTILFYPYVKYLAASFFSILVGLFVISILKKKDYFKPLD